MNEETAKINLNPRPRWTVNGCWNCSYYIVNMGKKTFCSLDACLVSPYQMCKDWKENE